MSGTPSRDLDYNRKITQAKKDAKKGIVPELVDIKPLLESYMDCPAKFKDSDDNTLSAKLYQLHLTADQQHPVKQELIDIAKDHPIGKSVASYLKNPAMVGVVR